MYKLFILFLLAPLLTGSAYARTWTNQAGKKLEAKVVKVNANKTVTLKTRRGKTVTLPFSTFIEADVQHLATLLDKQQHGKRHPIPWQQLNGLFGLPIWQDSNLWDDATTNAAHRMELQLESKTKFMENYRSYPLGQKKILSEPTYTYALYGGAGCVESLTFVFLNQGDIPLPEAYQQTSRYDSTPLPNSFIKEMTEKIEASGMRVHDQLEALLGKPKRDSLGKGNFREKVWRWNWNHHAIMLSLQEGHYAVLRIMPSERADRAGRGPKITEKALKQRLASCVHTRQNGDVIIENIPMVDQGPKGYCSPATWERYLRYMGIPADMYLLALAANTGVGGGTYVDQMMAAAKPLITSNGRELKQPKGSLSLELVATYIDQGLPIMWSFETTGRFQKMANYHTALRNKQPNLKPPKYNQNDDEPGGHICLIIGYNPRTDEIALSDSWGPRFSERWVPENALTQMTTYALNTIQW